MKTSTIVKLSVAIFLCIIFLALIGRKTRERVENFESQSYGNATPDESKSSNISGSGYLISETDDNNLSNLDLDNRHEIPTNKFCKLSTKTDEERERAIQNEAIEAKKQLDNHLRKKMAELSKKQAETQQPAADSCTYLRFPGILS